MGGVVPIGYRVENRMLHVVDAHAKIVRDLFASYLQIGSVVKLQAVLAAENVRLPVRADLKGKTTGGGLISRGHLYKILSNPIYVGRLGHKGMIHEGQHAAIISQPTWDAVQALLAGHAQSHSAHRLRRNCEALLLGKLFDDRGNPMSPSFAAKGGQRWRYYVSQAILQGRKAEAGSLARVSAPAIEKQVEDAITAHLQAASPIPPRDAIERVTVSRTTIAISLSDAAVADESCDRTLALRWTSSSTTRRREILQGDGSPSPSMRPMRTKARLGLIVGLRDAHRWLDELLGDPRTTIETIAAREGKTERSIRMTLSLAFLAPAIVEAGIEGKLPRGFGVTRLTDLPMAWSEQWNAIGIASATAN